MKLLLLAVLAATCGVQDENNGACGTLRERYDRCVYEQLLIERVGDVNCAAAKEIGTWQERDECRARLEHVIAPGCERYETYRMDVVGYKPPRTERERVAACVEVRLEPGDTKRHRKNLRGQCKVKVRADERFARLKAGLPVATIPRVVADACRKASKSPVQRSACCARYGLGGDCR